MKMPTTAPATLARFVRSGRLTWRPFTQAAALLVLAVVIVPTSTATAAGIDAGCAGTFTRTFSPAVTLIPRMVTVTETSSYSICAVGPTGTGTATATLTLGCIPVTSGPAISETLTWGDTTGDTSTINWSRPTIVGQTVVFTGTVAAGRHAGDSAIKVTSGVSYIGSVVGCLLGTPVSSTTSLVDSLLLTH
jgi:hypothetical protein